MYNPYIRNGHAYEPAILRYLLTKPSYTSQCGTNSYTEPVCSVKGFTLAPHVSYEENEEKQCERYFLSVTKESDMVGLKFQM